MNYGAPLADIRFLLNEIAGLAEISRLPGCEDATPDLVDAVLDEAGKFAAGVLAPLNSVGDRAGCCLEDGKVITPAGWTEAYKRFAEGGWVGLGLLPDYGGQGLPKCVATPVWEMWFSANTAFTMLPQLNTGEAEAILLAASDELKATYLQKLVTGEWGGTMNLTEPQAGSDLAAIRCRAEPQADGTYRISGQKLFISYGDHEITPNIVHLVLARLPDAPPGVKGISMFLVPKYLVNRDGSLGAKNDVRCVGLEHKLGIHGSPTCAMSFGDAGGATGWIVGQPNRGLEYMFIMMNEARFGVGVQGIGIGERAWQQALAFARERMQGRDAVTGQQTIKGSLWLLLSNRATLKETDQGRLDQLLAQNQPLASLYALKEQLQRLWQPNSTVAEMTQRLDDCCGMAKAAKITGLASFVKTLQSHRTGICAYANHPITTSRLEAGNVSIAFLRRRARGLRDMEYFKLKIFQLNTEDTPSFLYTKMPSTSCRPQVSAVGNP